MIKQTITRKGSFDSGHRVMNERFKCFNYHGHTYLYELTFSWVEAGSLGYAVDFKEIKRIACQWIDDILDHGFIANPQDAGIIGLCRDLGTKLYLMNLGGEGQYCNPSAENIAKEMFFAISILMNRTDETQFTLDKITLHETPNCSVECSGVDEKEWSTLLSSPLYKSLIQYKSEKGELEYDSRRV